MNATPAMITTLFVIKLNPIWPPIIHRGMALQHAFRAGSGHPPIVRLALADMPSRVAHVGDRG